jgi:hypothetical protein
MPPGVPVARSRGGQRNATRLSSRRASWALSDLNELLAELVATGSVNPDLIAARRRGHDRRRSSPVVT